MSDPTLYMVRLGLSTEGVVRSGLRERLPARDLDTGYLVHCQLRALFGDMAPKPFAVTGSRGRQIEVLGYASAPAEALRSHADAFADPVIHAACAWDRFASKPMPERWPNGHRVGFSLRACPVVRMASDGGHHHKGAEVDAFLARCWAAGETSVPVEREPVYRDWLGRTFERLGGARVLSSRIEGFKLQRMLRRTQGETRRGVRVERPDVVFSGTIEITNGDGFTGILQRGVGRHRAFGFGMLLLRPVERN